MKRNGRYRLLQASFWMLFCVGQGYITYYLTVFGYTPGQIGLLAAVFGLAAAFVQTRVGRLADRGGRWDWRRLILLLSACTAFSMAVLYVVSNQLAVGLLFGLFLLLINAMLPLVNAGCFYLNHQIAAEGGNERSVDFGFARGLGSFSFSALSFVLGRLTAAGGHLPVPVAGFCVAAATFLSAWYLRDNQENQTLVSAKEGSGKETDAVSSDRDETVLPKDEPAAGGSGFIRRYPVFLLMMAGLVPLLIFHNIIGTYLLQIMERVGGGSAQMGTAFAIAGICEIPMMFAMVRIKKHISSGALLVVAAVCYLLRCLLMIGAASVGMLYLTELLQMFTFALYASAAVYYAEEMMRPEDRSTGQALVGGVSTLGQAIGNLAGGLILQSFGVINLLWSGFAILCVGCVVIVLAYRMGRKKT